MPERPPLQRWWVSYFVVSALAVVLVLVGFMLLLNLLSPLSRVILLVMFGVIVAVCVMWGVSLPMQMSSRLRSRHRRLMWRGRPAHVLLFPG